MAKSKLEKLLLKAKTLNESTEKLVGENTKSVIKNTVEDVVRKYIKESVEEDEAESNDEMSYDESDVDVETGMDVNATGEDDSSEMGDDVSSGEELPIGDDADGEMPIDMDMGSEDEYSADSEEVMDLTNATEEEVLQALKNLPNDATIEIVKKDAFDVNVTQGSDGMDGMDGMEDPMDVSMPPVTSAEDDEFEGGDEDEEMGFDEEDEEDDDSLEEAIQEALREMDESSDNEELNEGEDAPYDNSVKVNVSKGGNNAPYETKAKQTVKEAKLIKAYNALLAENKRLKSNEIKAANMLEETMHKMKSLATINSKLAYTTRLFTENSTTKTEKVDVLKKMDTAKTVSECAIVFKMLSESLKKRVTSKKPSISTETLAEAKKTKSVIKEEKAYIDPENQRTLELMNYKPKR